MKKRWIITVYVAMALLVIAITAVQVAINSDQARHYFLQIINDNIQGEISLLSHHISLFSGRIAIADALLTDTDGTKVTGVKSCKIQISFLNLLTKKIHINKAIIQKPFCLLSETDTGELNIIRAVTPVSSSKKAKQKNHDSDSGFPINIKVEKLVFTDGRFAYRGEGKPVDIKSVDAVFTGRFSENNLYVKRLELITPEIKFTTKGSVQKLNMTPELYLETNISLNLSNLLQILNVEQPISGKLSALIKIDGPVLNPDVACQVNYSDGLVYGYPVSKATAGIKYAAEVLNINSFRLIVDSGKINVTGEVDGRRIIKDNIFSNSIDWGNLSWQFNLAVKELALDHIPKGNTSLNGVINTDITLNGKGVIPDQLTADVVLAGSVSALEYLDIFKQAALDINTEMRFQDKILTVKQLGIVSGDGQIKASGYYNTETNDINAILNGLLPSLSVLSDSFQGRYNMVAAIKGDISSPHLSSTLEVNNFKYNDYHIENGLAEVDLNPAGLCRLQTLSLRNHDMQVNGSGEIRLFDDGYMLNDQMKTDLSLTFSNVDPSAYISTLSVRGNINGVLSARGPLKDIKVDFNAKSHDLLLYDYTISDLAVRGAFEKGIATIDELMLSRNSSHVIAKGKINLFEPESFSLLKDNEIKLYVSGQNCQIADFYADASGRIFFKTELKGSLQSPEGMLELTGTDINWHQSFESIEAKAHLAQNKLSLKKLKLQVASEENITGSGSIKIDDGEYDVKLRSTPIMVSHVSLLKGSSTPEGYISTTITGKGNLNSPQLNGDIKLTRLNFKETSLPDIRITYSLKDSRIETSAEGGLDLKGMIDIVSKDYSAQFNLKDMALSPAFRFLRKEEFSGKLTGSIRVSGNLNRYLDSSGVININHVSVAYLDKGLFEAEDLFASYENRILTLPENNIKFAEGGHLSFSGEGQYPEKLNVELDGLIPAVMLHFISEEWPQMSGDILLAGGTNGKWGNPNVNIDFELRKIGIALPMLDQELKNLNGRIHASAGKVTFEKLEGYLEDGLLGMDGRIDLDHFRPKRFSVHIYAEKLPVKVPDTLSAIVSADLNLAGSPEDSELTGEVGLIEGIYFRDFNLSLFDAIRLPQKKVAGIDQQKDSPFLDNMKLNVRVYHRNPFEIENNLLTASIIPDLQIKGTAQKPILQGRVRTESGIVYFRNQDFNISQGSIDFVSPYKNDPEININSEVKIRNWDIKLYLSGPVDNLNFTFTSDPLASDEDILSLIIFGKTTGEMNSLESEGGLTTAQKLAVMVGSAYSEDIKNETGLDLVEVDTITDDDTSEEKIQVTVGKELSRRTMLKYMVELASGDPVQRAIAEYRLLEHFSVSGYQDSQGTFGGKLQYRYEFR
ncbi:MAG: translocation/assembly module TamB domain-containing protein [Desulfobacterales bacterium]|nr:translocation/assembly module TamB domain-containing protein [Desulfobacterales bacterium]